jgi:hypothetical protein
MPNYVLPCLSNANANSASPHTIGVSPRSTCTSPLYHRVKTNLLTLAESSRQANIQPIDIPPRPYDGATYLSVLLNIKSITNKEDSINKEVVFTINDQEEESLNNYYNKQPLSTATEVVVVHSPWMLHNPIVVNLPWLLVLMIVGCCAIAVLDQSSITLASRGEKILDHDVSQQGVVLQSPVLEADTKGEISSQHPSWFLDWAINSQKSNDDNTIVFEIADLLENDDNTVPMKKKCLVSYTTATLFVSIFSGIIAMITQVSQSEIMLCSMVGLIILLSCYVTLMIVCVTYRRGEDIMTKCTTAFKKVRFVFVLVD